MLGRVSARIRNGAAAAHCDAVVKVAVVSLDVHEGIRVALSCRICELLGLLHRDRLTGTVDIRVNDVQDLPVIWAGAGVDTLRVIVKVVRERTSRRNRPAPLATALCAKSAGVGKDGVGALILLQPA